MSPASSQVAVPAEAQTVRFDRYYSALPHLRDVFARRARRLALRAGSESEFAAWRRGTRAKLRELLGLARMEFCEPCATQLESEEQEYGRREKWIIQTEPDVWMPFYVLVPRERNAHAPAPALIAAHGHGGAGKLAVAGRNDIPAVRRVIERYHYDYGRAFCTRGFVVFCPDARGFGERREFYWGRPRNEDETDETFFLDSSCAILNQKAISLGLSLAGMWTWDLMRLIDHIATRPDCATGRVGCVGFSGGGLQTLWLAALDQRVRVAVISGNFFGFKDSIIEYTRCSCSYVPHLCEFVDVGDIAALIAPRPLLVESATEDELSGPRGLENVVEQMAITRRAYAVTRAEDRLRHHVFAGSHRWNGEATYPFVHQWLFD